MFLIKNLVCGQQQTQQPPVEVLKWCTINASEQDKCEEMAQFALLQVPQFGRAAMTIQCIRVCKLSLFSSHWN